MKKILFIFLAIIGLCGPDLAHAAKVLSPKKAAPVAKQETSMTSSNVGASLLPTAIGLVTNVMALSKQQKALTAECQPSENDLSIVNNLVKEWAIAGGAKPMRGVSECYKKDGYRESVTEMAANKNDTSLRICWDVYGDDEARGAVWAGYPKAEIVEYCEDGDCGGNAKKLKTSNVWDILAGIGFSDADYTRAEASQVESLRQKADKCSDTKLAAQKREAVGGLITSTIGGLGQSQNAAGTMDMVKGLIGQQGGGIGNVANIATQFLGK